MQYVAADFSFELTGLPAFLLICALFYLLVYLPIKIIVAVVAKIKQKHDRIKNLQMDTIVAEYEVPEGLTPAEIGYLYDSRLRESEIYGTIVYLQQQGLIIFSESSQFVINGTKQASQELKPFERYVLRFMSHHKGEVLTMRMLRKVKREGSLVLNKQLREAGYLLSVNEQMKQSFIRLGLLFGSLVVLIIALFRPHNFGDIISALFLCIVLSPVFFVMTIFLYFTIQKIAGEPWLLSAQTKKVWPDIEGYSQYIKQVELDNLQFETKETKTVAKNKALPYAIALDHNTGWRRQIR